MTTETTAPRPRRRTLAWVAAAAVGALLLAFVVVLAQGRPEEPRGAALPEAPTSSPTASGAAGSGTVAPGASSAPDAPAEEPALAELLVPAAGSYASADLAAVAGEDAQEGDVPQEPPVALFAGSFTNGRDVVRLVAADRATPEAAAAAAAPPPAGFTDADLVESGDVGDPVVGSYRFYLAAGDAALRWTNGPFVLELTGPPVAVRELYLAYPL